MNPRALLMDEPFGALDAHRPSMQQLLLEVWQQLGTTVLFVTHDIDEAILLSDRICIMSARPGRIIKTIPIELARPRSIASLTSPEFMAYKAEIMSDMKVKITFTTQKQPWPIPVFLICFRRIARRCRRCRATHSGSSRRQRRELAVRPADAAHHRHAAARPRDGARRAEFFLGRLRHARRTAAHSRAPLRRAGLAASTSFNAGVIDAYPEAAIAMRDAGWEFIGHGMHQKAINHVEGGEEGRVRASLDKIAGFTGTAPARLVVAGPARNGRYRRYPEAQRNGLCL